MAFLSQSLLKPETPPPDTGEAVVADESLPSFRGGPQAKPKVKKGPRFVIPAAAYTAKNKKPEDPDTAREWFSPEFHSHLTTNELASYSPKAAQEATRHINKLPSEKHLAALAKAGRAGRDWYRSAGSTIKNIFGEDAPRFIALLASTSPNRSVRENTRLATYIWGHYKQLEKQKQVSGRGITEKDILRMMGQVSQEGQADSAKGFLRFQIKTLLPNIVRSLRSDVDPGDTLNKVLSGEQANKVDSFRKNLLQEFMASTNDTWVGKIMGLPKGKAGLDKSKTYHAVSAKMRRTADHLNQNLESGETPWTAADVQAATWSAYRTLALIQGASHWTPQQKQDWEKDNKAPLPEKPVSYLGALAFMTHGHVARGANFVDLLTKDPVVQKNLSGANKASAAKREAAAVHANPPTHDPTESVCKGLSDDECRALEAASYKAKSAMKPFRDRRIQNARHGLHLKFAAPVQPAQAQQVLQQPAAQTQPQQPDTGNSAIAASPNVQENLSFDQAFQRTMSGNQKAFKKITEGMLEQLGLKGKTQNAIGDWEDGAENSVYQEIQHPADPKAVEYAAAWYGLLGNQKSVLVFHANPNGPDSFYQIKLPTTDVAKVRDLLSKAGIQYRTLVPSDKGVSISIYDEGRGLRDKVQKFAGEVYASISESAGSGKFIGGSTRTAARAAYRKLIDQYEAAGPAGAIQAKREAVLGNNRGPSAAGSLAFSRQGRKLRFAGVHSPKDGVIVRGVFYKGGKWIPKAELEKATWPQYEHVAQQRAKLSYAKRGDGSVDPQQALGAAQEAQLIPTAKHATPADYTKGYTPTLGDKDLYGTPPPARPVPTAQATPVAQRAPTPGGPILPAPLGIPLTHPQAETTDPLLTSPGREPGQALTSAEAANLPRISSGRGALGRGLSKSLSKSEQGQVGGIVQLLEGVADAPVKFETETNSFRFKDGSQLSKPEAEAALKRAQRNERDRAARSAQKDADLRALDNKHRKQLEVFKVLGSHPQPARYAKSLDKSGSKDPESEASLAEQVKPKNMVPALLGRPLRPGESGVSRNTGRKKATGSQEQLGSLAAGVAQAPAADPQPLKQEPFRQTPRPSNIWGVYQDHVEEHGENPPNLTRRQEQADLMMQSVLEPGPFAVNEEASQHFHQQALHGYGPALIHHNWKPDDKDKRRLYDQWKVAGEMVRYLTHNQMQPYVNRHTLNIWRDKLGVLNHTAAKFNIQPPAFEVEDGPHGQEHNNARIALRLFTGLTSNRTTRLEKEGFREGLQKLGLRV